MHDARSPSYISHAAWAISQDSSRRHLRFADITDYAASRTRTNFGLTERYTLETVVGTFSARCRGQLTVLPLLNVALNRILTYNNLTPACLNFSSYFTDFCINSLARVIDWRLKQLINATLGSMWELCYLLTAKKMYSKWLAWLLRTMLVRIDRWWSGIVGRLLLFMANLGFVWSPCITSRITDIWQHRYKNTRKGAPRLCINSRQRECY